MQEYLRTQLHFPVKKGITVKDFWTRLAAVNTKLARFPKSRGASENQVNYLSDEELKLVLLRTVPVTWQQKLATSGRTTYQHSTESLVEYLDAVQVEMAAQAKSKAEKKAAARENEQTKKNKNKNKKFSSGDGNGKPTREKRFCRHCKENGAPPDVYRGHNTEKCKWPDGRPGTGKRKREKDKKFKKDFKKMFAFFEQYQKKEKKRRKKKSRGSSSSSDSSDSE